MELADLQAYKRIRDAVFEGGLRVVREEMLGMMYKLYMYLLARAADGAKVGSAAQDSMLEELLGHRRDFQDFAQFNEQVKKCLDILASADSPEEKAKRFRAELKSEPNKHIELSRYSYEVLITFIERENHNLLKDFLFNPASPDIRLKKDLQAEDTSSAFLFTRASAEELAQTNAHKLLAGLDPVEHTFWTRLLRQSASKVHPVEDSEFALGKRLFLMDEQSDLLGEKKLSTGRQPLGYKADFVKEFISNARIQAAEKSQPNVLKIGINDYYGLVTVVEANHLMKLVLLGSSKGEITCVFLQKTAQCFEEDTERMRLEQNERDREKRENQNNAPESEQTAGEEFQYDLNSLSFSGHSSPITALSLRCDSRRFVSGSLDGEIRLWDLQLQECLAVFREHFEAVFALKMAPKNELFASAGSEAVIYLWSEASKSRVKSFIGHHYDVCHVEFTANMRYLVSSAMDCTLRVWDLEDGECKRVVKFQSYVNTFALNLNGDLVIAACDNKDLCFVNLLAEFNHIFYCTKLATFGPAEGRIRKIALSPDERHLSLLKKSSVAYCSFEEVFKLKREVEACSKGDKEAILKIWNKDHKSLVLNAFHHDKLDFFAQTFAVNNTIVAFYRNNVN